jgi:DNA-binding transcriptional ArsR family regulator
MEKLAEQQAEIFSIFSNAKRVLIFWSLDGLEMSVNDIADAICSSVQNTSQHLRLMKGKGILESRRDGQTIYYRIADNEIGRYCRYINEESQKKISDIL